MAVTASRVTVDTTGGGISIIAGTVGHAARTAVGAGRTTVFIKNPVSNAQTVYLGPSGVTSGTGFELAPGEVATFDQIGPGDAIFGITAAASAVVHVLVQS